jgi:hypothetical protein
MAQEVDESARAAARQVGNEGLQAYNQGQYGVALEKLNRAYAVVQAPTIGLWIARAMVQLGQLVEGAERYLEVTRIEIVGGDVELQKEAKRVAAEEREALLPRIPQLKVLVEGVPPDQVSVQLDGQDVPIALLGLERPVNPGVRRVEGRFGEQVVTEEATLAEGETKTMTLIFTAPPAVEPESPRAVSATAPATAATSPAQSPADDTRLGPMPGTRQRILGWLSTSIGGAGLAVWGVTGAMLLAKRNELDSSDECVNQACGPAKHDTVEDLNALRPVSTLGFVVGGVGLATGLTLLLTAPDNNEGAKPRVTAWVSTGSAGLRGEF